MWVGARAGARVGAKKLVLLSSVFLGSLGPGPGFEGKLLTVFKCSSGMV